MMNKFFSTKILTLTLLFSTSIIFAEQVKVTVIDGELDMPLEGAKVFLNEDRNISAETDMDGNAVLEFGDGFKGGNLVCQFPGYVQSISRIKSGDTEVKFQMRISDFLEGKEIVVSRKAEKHTQESGVSVVMTKEQMDTTARTGLVEDVMASVNTMPGISFGGQWVKEPSVRGGYPKELAYTLDGVYMMFPWHWGGSYSIFSPSFVESTKLNNGVFSSEYGRAVSGLLEVNTIMPDDQIHFSFDLNYTSSSIFLSSPLGKKAGIIVGAKATYLETLLWTFRKISSSSLTDMVSKAPYIRDVYVKGFYTPADKVMLTANGFFGSDGIGIDQSAENAEDNDGVKSTGNINYDYYQGLAGLDAKWMPTEKLTFNGKLSWNLIMENINGDTRDFGFIRYNPDFLAQYSDIILEKDKIAGGYFLNTQNKMEEKITNHLIQGKATSEYKFSESSRIKAGVEEVVALGNVKEDFSGWHELTIGGKYPYYGPMRFNGEADNNRTFGTSGFALWNFGTDDSLVKGETGLRIDHMMIKGDGIDISSAVDVNPRASVHFTPWRDKGPMEKVMFTTGCGLFSAIPFDSVMVNKKIVVDSNIKQDRALFSVIGTEINFRDNWKVSLEGYFKYYLNRLYVVNDESNPTNLITKAYTDGKGYSTGFDLMVQKSAGEKWNGYLTYSFIYAKYMNPTAPQYSNQRTAREDPLDEWYYPNFHRFHTLNMIVNFKPTPRWTITVKGTLATGTPRTDGTKYSYPVKLADGTVMQRYTRSWFYSDTLRTDISCPIDIRVSHTGTFKKNPKWKWEWYLGAEDIFMNLYSPKTSQQFNQTTGKDSENSNANFSIGIPMISVGYKVSFN